MDNSRQRLDEALSRRDALQRDVERLKGRLDAARQAQARVEEECRNKGINPNDLDATLEKLAQRYQAAVSDLETRITAAEEAVKPFAGED